MASARISPKGEVVIPAPLRKKYRLQPGDQVRIVDYGGGLALVPALGNPIKITVGLPALAGRGIGVVLSTGQGTHKAFWFPERSQIDN